MRSYNFGVSWGWLERCFLRSVVCALLTAGCRSLLYHPTHLTPEELGALANEPGWSFDELEIAPEETLVGLVREPQQADAPWLLYFGGNAMSLRSSKHVLEHLAADEDWGLAVWAYRGYDGSAGSPTQRALLTDARAAAERLRRVHGVEPERLIVVGQSLGTGIAMHTAAYCCPTEHAPAGLVLVSPYTSMARVFDEHAPLPIGWALSDDYPSATYLSDVSCPVLIVHGARDDVIAVQHSRDLEAQRPDHVELVVFDELGHNDIWSSPRVVDIVRDFIRSRGSPPP